MDADAIRESAIARFRAVAGQDPPDAAAAAAIALVRAASGACTAALADLSGLAADPRAPFPDLLSFLRVRCLREAGQAAEARPLLDALLARRPELLEVQLEAGLLELALGRPAAAVALLSRAAERFAGLPGRVQLLADLCVAHERLGQPAEGLRLCDEALADPELRHPALRANRAAFLAMLGRYEEARCALIEAVADDPDVPALLLNLGYVTLRLGHTDEARAALRAACAAEPALAPTCERYWAALGPAGEAL